MLLVEDARTQQKQEGEKKQREKEKCNKRSFQLLNFVTF
jgi:hypothetical protein